MAKSKPKIGGDPVSSVSIEMIGQIYNVKTLVDNGIRVTLDLPETAVMQAAQLMECQIAGVALEMKFVPKIWTELDHETKTDTEGKGAGVGSRRSINRRDQRASE